MCNLYDRFFSNGRCMYALVSDFKVLVLNVKRGSRASMTVQWQWPGLGTYSSGQLVVMFHLQYLCHKLSAESRISSPSFSYKTLE